MRSLIGYLLGVLILTLFVIFPIGTAYAQGEDKALDFDGSKDYVDRGSSEDIDSKPNGEPQRLRKKTPL